MGGRRRVLLGITVAWITACAEGGGRPTAEAGRGEWMPSGKADEFATCEGACGGEAVAGCWCDADCEDYGDCCPDVAPVCWGESECGDDAGSHGNDGGAGGEPTGDCVSQLEALGAEFTMTDHDAESPSGFPGLLCEIEDPVLLHGPINGVGLRYFENDQDTPVLMSCEAARSVVESAAIARSLGADEIIHMGTYNCRVIAGTSKLSEHASGNAIDIFGFTLEDGTEISVLEDWEDGVNDPVTADGRRLRDFTDRLWADDLWNVILTPEFNAAHDNHVHLDRTPGGNTYQ